MQPYGVKRNWNHTEDNIKNGVAKRPKTHSKTKKICNRQRRRTDKHNISPIPTQRKIN